jgi:hypothetical protein
VTKISLNSGEIELLASSLLDLVQITTTQISELYQLRWPVEEAYKNLKPKMKLEQFSCRHYKGIYQEFYTPIFMLNLTSLLGNQAQKQITQRTQRRKLSYQYNWQNAFKFVRDKFISLMKSVDIQSQLSVKHPFILCHCMTVVSGHHVSQICVIRAFAWP